MTLIPHPEEAARSAATPITCLVCGELGTVDVFLNVLLFVPLGLGLRLAGFSWRRTVALGAALSLGIELLQMKVIAGRDASLGDLITNSLGAGLGAWLAASGPGLLRPTLRSGRRLVLGWSALLILIYLGTSLALRPALPTGVPWWGQWAPDLGHLDRFPGRVLSVTAAGLPLPPGRAIDQRQLESALNTRTELTTTAVLGTATNSLAPIASIFDADRREVVLLGQDGTDLVWRVRMWSAKLGLRNPGVRLPGVLAPGAGDTVTATGRLRGPEFQIRADRGAIIRSWALPFSASWGWSLVLPWPYAFGPEARFLTALWVAGLLFPLGLWGVRAQQSGWALMAAIPIVLLAVIPATAGFSPVHWSEWLAAFTGLGAGVAASRWIGGPDARDFEDPA
ncbi:MAG TPA: VanZ family protein [Gemmatimonadales bacterium]|nr:VanZ family protein [Gemmatimonadales bacterium]